MQIGFDAKRAFLNNTGLGNYSRMIICALADAHPEVDIVLFTPSAEGKYAGFWDKRTNISVVTPKGLWRLFPSLWRSIGMGDAIRRLGLDLFHGLSHELPLARRGKTRYIVSMHDLIVWRYPKQFPLFDRIVYKCKQRYSCRRADTIVAVSRQTERDLVELLHVDGSKVKVVYQSCDAIFRNPVTTMQRAAVRAKYQLPERYVVCVGTIEQRKNQATVVEAMSMVSDDVHLVVVGKKSRYFDVVADVVGRYGLSRRVHILDKADFADFPALYSEAEASVYMSYFEGFGIPVLESLTCGTPVVASCRSSIPEVGGDAALYAEPSSPREIADSLNRLLDDGEMRSAMRERAKIQASCFEPTAIISDYFEILTILLAESRF